MPVVHRPSSGETGEDQRPLSMDDFGISVTFSGPEQVRVGEILRWDMLLLNRSGRRRSLAVIAIDKRKRTEPKHYAGQGSDGSVAHAVLDEHSLYTLQTRATAEPAGLVSLSPDVRIGYVS